MSKPPSPRKWKDNEASARAQNVRISPYKLGLVVDSIIGLPASKAIVQLDFSRKRISKEVKQVLVSAVANAENNHGLNIDRLVVARANVGKGLVMKRLHTRARGRAARVLKPFSHLEIIVREQEEQE